MPHVIYPTPFHLEFQDDTMIPLEQIQDVWVCREWTV